MANWANLIVALGAAYAVAGSLVAAAFLLFGIERIDPATQGSYMFRALLFPGLVLLWPVVLLRWFGAVTWLPRQTPLAGAVQHLVGWLCLAVMVPGLIIFALSERQIEFPVLSSQQLNSVEVRP